MSFAQTNYTRSLGSQPGFSEYRMDMNAVLHPNGKCVGAGPGIQSCSQYGGPRKTIGSNAVGFNRTYLSSGKAPSAIDQFADSRLFPDNYVNPLKKDQDGGFYSTRDFSTNVNVMHEQDMFALRNQPMPRGARLSTVSRQGNAHVRMLGATERDARYNSYQNVGINKDHYGSYGMA